jgi:hypothetical protein
VDLVERRHLDRIPWWTLDELTVTTDTVYPAALVDLFRALLAASRVRGAASAGQT